MSGGEMQGRKTGEARIVEHVTCLGCGCACDDIAVTVRDARIAGARHACPLGSAWFGDGVVPQNVLSHGSPASLDAALDEAAAILASARRALVYLAPDISCETQRAAIAIADHLAGVVDSVTSATAKAGTLATQRRGRVVATLGEVRNRADVIVFWATDPADRYPRYSSRYAPDPKGLFIPNGRESRTVAAVDVGDERAPADADLRVALAPGEELDAIAVLRATAAQRTLDDRARDLTARTSTLAATLAGARYAVIVYDAEADANPRRTEALIALTQQLNDRVRCSLSPLRGGGNRTGADAVMTWQTGYPMTIDFSRGAPRYRPDDDAGTLLHRGAIDAMLLVGDPRSVALDHARTRRIIIGPHATEFTPAADVAIDTAVAGIHEGGMVFRMDDIPLPLRPPLSGPREAAALVRALGARLQNEHARRPM